MRDRLLHILRADNTNSVSETEMTDPFALPPHPLACAAAEETLDTVREYMCCHPNSELHRQGKMFGVLVVHVAETSCYYYLRAFSAMLDGTYDHEGYVPPIADISTLPIGTSREDSRRLQQLLFSQYKVKNIQGEERNLLDIFAEERGIVNAEDWFERGHRKASNMPPAGAGECCAPKLLQYAFSNGWRPVALAEFWVGAPSNTDIRQEGQYYAPCSGRCRPILRYMLHKERDRLFGLPASRHSCSYKEIDVVYEDEWLMVVNKPAGLLSVPGTSGELSLVDIMETERKIKLLPVHRLDQDTSGILVLAKTKEVYKELQAYFQRHDILKRYEAVVEGGNALKPEGIIDLPLLPNPYDRPRQMVNKAHGKRAFTSYRLREQRSDGRVLLDLYPMTGRTHQLRVHAAHPEGLNAPIVGDRLYGDGQQANRLMLHAAEIRFVHPITKEEMHFCIPSNF